MMRFSMLVMIWVSIKPELGQKAMNRNSHPAFHDEDKARPL